LRRVTAWSVGWLFAAGLYLLLIDTTSLPELLVGVAAAGLAATGFELARESGAAGPLGTRLRWLLAIRYALLKVPADVASVSLVALRQLRDRRTSVGAFRTAPFRRGSAEELATGRRALAQSFGSFAPNTIVIGVDPERELILAHQLRVTGGSEAVDVTRLG